MDNYIGLCELCSSPEPCNQCLGLPLIQEKIKAINPQNFKNEYNKLKIEEKNNRFKTVVREINQMLEESS